MPPTAKAKAKPKTVGPTLSAPKARKKKVVTCAVDPTQVMGLIESVLKRDAPTGRYVMKASVSEPLAYYRACRTAIARNIVKLEGLVNEITFVAPFNAIEFATGKKSDGEWTTVRRLMFVKQD